VLNRRLLRSFSARRLLVAGLAINAVGALALLTVGRLSLPVYASCFIALIASWGLISANGTALAVRDYAPVAGAALALVGILQYTTGALAAPLAGVVGDGTAVPVAIVVSWFSVVGLASVVLTVKGERRRAGIGSGVAADALREPLRVP
jgi:DHA1 family bicyclomycin/chloramphenicol resistance-like MFS transporter